MIYLPESDNDNIKLAYLECKKLGINVLMPQNPDTIDNALIMLNDGKIDAVVCGITMPTADVIRCSLKIIGCEDKIVSSYFIMQKGDEKLLFADCAVVPNPNPEQLAKIAIQTANSAKRMGITPKLAFLSYSTSGSTVTNDTNKIKEAINLLPDDVGFDFDGEWQFDAAYSLDVRNRKVRKDSLRGEKANIFIFPDLNSGNIGYKIAQQLGRYTAIGPILQGLKKPVCDLSRGATVDDIVEIIKVVDSQLIK